MYYQSLKNCKMPKYEITNSKFVFKKDFVELQNLPHALDDLIVL